MRPRDVTELLVLSLLWGTAYLFTRAAVPAFGPAALVALRLGLAAVLLLPMLLLWRRGGGELAARWRVMLLLGVPFTALPFLLMSYAALHITAGLIAVLNATAPLFAALLARFVYGERLGPWKGTGLLVGVAGVTVLVWGNAAFRSADGALAVAAALGTSICWALGADYTKRRLSNVDPMVVAVGSLLVASVALAPWAAAAWPAQPPSPQAWAELVYLGLASSALGFLIYFHLLRRVGPVPAMSVTFLNPVVAAVSGAIYLGEAITLQMVVGGAIVLTGTALGLGLIGPAAPATAVRAGGR